MPLPGLAPLNTPRLNQPGYMMSSIYTFLHWNFMLLRNSSSLLRASHFFPECYWAATSELQPGQPDGDVTSAPGRPAIRGRSQCSIPNVECSPSFNHFSSFSEDCGLSRAGGDNTEFSPIWNPERLTSDHNHSGPAYLKTKLVSRVHSAGVSLNHFDQMWTILHRPGKGNSFNSVDPLRLYLC